MKLPLFVCASSSASLSSPLVLVKKGTWKLTSNHKASKLELRSEEQELNLLIQDGMEFEVKKEYVLLRAVITENGKEGSLSIFLESVRKDDRHSGSDNGKS